MLSRSWRASSGASTGVLPRLTLWAGPRTEAAGLVGITWPITSQSNRRRIAARRCFAVGAGARLAQRLDVGGDVERLDGRDRGDPPALAPGQEFAHGAGVGAARVWRCGSRRRRIRGSGAAPCRRRPTDKCGSSRQLTGARKFIHDGSRSASSSTVAQIRSRIRSPATFDGPS